MATASPPPRPWARTRRWALHALVALLLAAAIAVIAIVAIALGATRAFFQTAWVAVSFVWIVWLTWNRVTLLERVDEATDAADQALGAMTTVLERQDVTYRIAVAARRETTVLRDAHATHRHPVPEPATDPVGVPAHPPTAPRPAVDAVAGGARVTAQPAERPAPRGRHAAPDTGVHDAVRQADAS